MIYRIFNKKGFTIVELIIAVSLLVLVLTTGFMVFSTLSKNFAMGTDQAYVQQNIRFVDEYFKNNIRNIGQLHIGSTQPFDPGYSMFMEDGAAKTDNSDITDYVLTDIEVRLDFSDDFLGLDYRITGEDGGRTYEIENSIVLNNIPTDSVTAEDLVSETYDGNYISLVLNRLFFNYDPIHISLRRVVASPSIITTGHVYGEGVGEEGLLTLYLILQNESFLSGVDTIDINFDGKVSALTPVELYRENKNMVVMKLSGSTPLSGDIGFGNITVYDSGLLGEGDLTFEIPVEDPYAAYLIIDGEANITIPQVEGNTYTSEYSAVVYDQGTNPMPTEGVTWQLASTYTGVTVISSDSNSFTIEVSHEAVPGSIYIEAAAVSADIAWQYKVDLLAP